MSKQHGQRDKARDLFPSNQFKRTLDGHSGRTHLVARFGASQLVQFLVGLDWLKAWLGCGFSLLLNPMQAEVWVDLCTPTYPTTDSNSQSPFNQFDKLCEIAPPWSVSPLHAPDFL